MTRIKANNSELLSQDLHELWDMVEHKEVEESSIEDMLNEILEEFEGVERNREAEKAIDALYDIIYK